jgi:hypothetical protein
MLGPTTKSARAGSQSKIHPNRSGRRWARITYRTQGYRRVARNTGSGAVSEMLIVLVELFRQLFNATNVFSTV